MKIWTKWLIIGVLSAVFGVLVLSNPVAGSLSVTILAGIMFAASGVFQLVTGFSRTEGPTRLVGIGLGILMTLLGVSLMFDPLGGVLSLTLLVTVLLAASGVSRLMAAFRMQQTPFFWPMLLSGALTVLLAGYITANFFEVAPKLLGVLLGIELLFNSAGLIVLALFLRAIQNSDNNNG